MPPRRARTPPCWSDRRRIAGRWRIRIRPGGAWRAGTPDRPASPARDTERRRCCLWLRGWSGLMRSCLCVRVDGLLVRRLLMLHRRRRAHVVEPARGVDQIVMRSERKEQGFLDERAGQIVSIAVLILALDRFDDAEALAPRLAGALQSRRSEQRPIGDLAAPFIHQPGGDVVRIAVFGMEDDRRQPQLAAPHVRLEALDPVALGVLALAREAQLL